MTARLANGGKAVKPHLTKQVVPFDVADPVVPEIPEFKSIGIHPPHLNMINKAMGAVSNSPYGTAYKSRIKEPGFQLAAKTGTVQVRRITKAERETGVKKNKDLEWRERDHALFVGYAPLKNPRYAVSVVVEHGGGGSSIAAPIAKDILMEVQRRDPSRGQSGKAAKNHNFPNSTTVKKG
jgi:penicillin-binding protein 2